MQLKLDYGLPFVSIHLFTDERSVTVDNVLIDTGSASTILAARIVEQAGIEPRLDDTLYTIRGVGGIETVYARSVPSLSVGEVTIRDVEVEIGSMAYGFPIDGILGMDILTQTGAVINLSDLTLDFAKD